MSDFRFGVDDYRLNYYPHDGVHDEQDFIDWSKVECVQIDWETFVRERACEQVLTDCDDGLMPPFTAHCSVCGTEWGFTPKYCHNCGAKVTGTRDERKAVDR